MRVFCKIDLRNAHCLSIRSNEETIRIEHFSSQENDNIFHIFVHIKV